MITRRDAQVIAYLDTSKAAKTDTLFHLFYPSYPVAARRLSSLSESGEIKRERDGWSSQYCYYTHRPKQLHHALAVTDFHTILKERVDLRKYIIEPTLGNIRPDAVAGYVSGGKEMIALVEVELSHKGFNTDKYSAFDWKRFFPIPPLLIVVTDYRVPKMPLQTIVCKTDFSNLSL